MGSSQSNAGASLLTSEVAVTGLILLAGAYIFATQSGVLAGARPDATTTKGASISSSGAKGAKNKKKASGGKKDKNASDKSKSDLASSVDTLVAIPDELGAGKVSCAAI